MLNVKKNFYDKWRKIFFFNYEFFYIFSNISLKVINIDRNIISLLLRNIIFKLN